MGGAIVQDEADFDDSGAENGGHEGEAEYCVDRGGEFDGLGVGRHGEARHRLSCEGVSESEHAKMELRGTNDDHGGDDIPFAIASE